MIWYYLLNYYFIHSHYNIYLSLYFLIYIDNLLHEYFLYLFFLIFLYILFLLLTLSLHIRNDTDFINISQF